MTSNWDYNSNGTITQQLSTHQVNSWTYVSKWLPTEITTVTAASHSSCPSFRLNIEPETITTSNWAYNNNCSITQQLSILYVKHWTYNSQKRSNEHSTVTASFITKQLFTLQVNQWAHKNKELPIEQSTVTAASHSIHPPIRLKLELTSAHDFTLRLQQ